MFGRGTWAIIGLAQDSLESFRTTLENRTVMAGTSQLAAVAVTRHFSADALGLNPFRGPRLDEEFPLPLEHQEALAQYAITEHEEGSDHTLPDEVLACGGYGATEEKFKIHPSMPWYGLWAVSNEYKDVGDLASIKEHKAYVQLERPYKFLQAIDKKTIEQDLAGVTASMRVQVPVLLDFNDGRIYIESSNKKLIYAIVVRLQQLGAGAVPVAWTYNGRPNWPSAILNKLYEGTQFQDDFIKRADEATRFKPKEIEKLDDKELEGIVANFFSMTQLPSDLWVGISGPAQVRLHDTTPPIGVKAPTTATTLLQMTNGANVLSGALTFQERISFTGKDGSDRTFRKDLFCLDVNDRINLTDAGSAMLRGFDLPSWRKDLLREMRQTNEAPSIEQFWANWLHELSNAVRTIEATFRELLELDGDQEAGILPMKTPGAEPAPDLSGV